MTILRISALATALLVAINTQAAPLSSAADGEWLGTIACGRMTIQTANPDPWKDRLALMIEGGIVTGKRSGPNFREVFNGAVDRQGNLMLQAEGERLDNPTILWRYRAKGKVEGTALQMSGAMEAWTQTSGPNAVTRLRECVFDLRNASAEKAAEQAKADALERERLDQENRQRAEREQREAALRQEEALTQANRARETAMRQQLPNPALPAAPSNRTRVMEQPASDARSRTVQRPTNVAPSPAVPTKEIARIEEEHRSAERSRSQAATDAALAATKSAQAAADRAAAQRAAAEREAVEAATIKSAEVNRLAAAKRAAAERAAAERAAAEREAADKATSEKARKPPVKAQSTLDL